MLGNPSPRKALRAHTYTPAPPRHQHARVRARVRAHIHTACCPQRRASVDTGSHSHSPGGPTELTIGSDRILQIDFDTRLSVIATHLRARKSEHVEQLAAYAAEQRAAEALLSEQRELEQARQMFGFFAEEEAADIGGKSSLMTIQRPHLRLIANNQELSQMVTDAILQTGDRIAADLPVDPNISVRRVLIRAGAIPPYGSSAS